MILSHVNFAFITVTFVVYIATPVKLKQSVRTTDISGFGGLAGSMLASGSLPAEAVGFFGRKNPQYAVLRKGSKAVCPMSQICGISKNRKFLAHFRYSLTEFSGVALHRAPLEMTDRTKWRRTKGLLS
jgi:hypothetical protein